MCKSDRILLLDTTQRISALPRFARTSPLVSAHVSKHGVRLSLDQDMRKLRLDRYTPQAADEVRTWVEGVLGDRLASGDLLEALKDGVALCK